jgi:hypothetical protein
VTLSRSLPVPSRQANAEPETETGLIPTWNRFWFASVDPFNLHLVRLLAGLLFLGWLLPFAYEVEAFYGRDGWFDQSALDALAAQPDGFPPQNLWSILYLFGTSATLLTAAYWTAIGLLVLFTLGVWPRLTALLTWVIVLSFSVNLAASYDGEVLLIVLAFYLMVGYLFHGLGDASATCKLLAALFLLPVLLLARVIPPLRRRLQPLTSWLLGPTGFKSLLEAEGVRRLFRPGLVWPLRRSRAATSFRESVAANVALRLMQVHFAIIMLATALHKLQYGDWWAGVTFWHFVYPPFDVNADKFYRTYVMSGTTYLIALSALAYLNLAWQLAFPFFAWRPRWRPLLLGGAAIGWLGSVVLYELPLFGPALCIFCLSYLSAADWHRLASIPVLAGLLGRFTRFVPEGNGRSPRSRHGHSVASVRNP